MRATIRLTLCILALGAAGCSKDDAKKAVDDARTAVGNAAANAQQAMGLTSPG